MISQPKNNMVIILKNLSLTAIVIGLVAVLVFLIQGWTVDQEGKPVQSGLVQFATNLTGSTDKINGSELSEKTGTKTLLSPGE
jgi:FtsZ-interacting cell division protein ZipA